MQPVNLELINYRTITNAKLNLSAITAASITGVNGAGKSSICESISYALYGESRSLSVDGIVQNGAEELSVLFDYAHDGNVYRVIRKRSRNKKSELQYLMSNGNGWQTLSGATIADTQAKINADLAMDKNLFLSTSFVQQDKSAGFCDAGAAERKNVLSSIFEDRLGKFPALHDKTKLKVKGIDSEQMMLNDDADRLRTAIDSGDGILESKKRLEDELQHRTDELTREESILDNYKADQAKAQAVSDKLSGLQKQLADINEEIEALMHVISKNEAIIDDSETLIASADKIKADCEKADELEKQLELLSKLQMEYQDLTNHYKEKESEYSQSYSNMKLDENKTNNAINERINKHQNELRKFNDKKTSLENQLTSAKSLSGLLDEVPCKGGSLADECKLLSNARNAAETIATFADEIENNDKLIIEAKTSLDNETRELQGYSETMTQAFRQLDIEKTFALDELKKQGQALGYDRVKHNELIAKYETVKLSRTKLSEVAAAESRVKASDDAIEETKRQIRGKEFQIIGVEKDIEAIKGKSSGIDLLDVIRRKSEAVEYLKSEINQLNRQIAVKEADLENLAKSKTELISIENKIGELSKQRTLYATLQQAFSRDGIPALIIDAAIPDIEERANDVLSRLSDGKMSLKFITQKNSKTAGIAETLDIIISDTAWGERSYEEWSGGEKLRINLSVRIALGEILAARTGAKIELLVLDEVCGPLDEAGKTALIDCVNKLQTSFACILLITHHESVKERMPQQIDVVPTITHGSLVSIRV